MSTEKIPEIYFKDGDISHDIFMYDFKMTSDVVNSRVNLGMHMFSFLQEGKKRVHFADASIAVNKKQSLLLKKGNWLWTELLDKEKVYYCKLLFFSEETLHQFLEKHGKLNGIIKEEKPYFVIKNDPYLDSFLNTIQVICERPNSFLDNLVSLKLEELLLYLLGKYGLEFEVYLYSLVKNELSPFKKIIESKIHSNLKLEEIAFLCNMSLSTFKRHFIKEYQVSPGKWLKDRRLQKAKEILEADNYKPSDIFMDFGYNNLSNFSIAFKNKFGMSPNKISNLK